MTNTLTFQLLGGLRISQGGHPVSGFHSGKERALLCYLVVTGRRHHRSLLAGLFWGDLPESRALANLRRALSHLRRVAGDHLLINRRTAAFDQQSDYWLDVEAFEATTDRGAGGPGALREAVDLYRGDFLAGFHVKGCPSFEEWVLGEQERLRGLAAEALRTLVELHGTRGEYPTAIAYARRLLTLDPWREEAHRELMRLLALTGQRSAALAQYETCRQVLETELDLEPLKETTALYDRLVDWETGRWSGPQGSEGMEEQAGLTIGQMKYLPFTGREKEHAALTRWWNLSEGEKGRLILVQGEAGVGKTRLVEEVIRYAEADGALVLRGRCYEFGGTVPYHPIAQALRDYLRGEDAKTRIEGDAKTARQERRGTRGREGGRGEEVSFGPLTASPALSITLSPVWLSELARLLPELRHGRPDLPELARIAGEAARQRLFEAVTRFLEEMAHHRSCLLFLDDLHWADQATLDLLHYVVRRVTDSPIWIVGTYRPEELDLSHPLTRLRQGLRRDGLVESLRLPPLAAEAVEEIAHSLVGKRNAASFGDFLYRESEGNPFILTEVVTDLEEQGALGPRGGKEAYWRWSGPPKAEVLPVGVREVVLQRVGRLRQEAQRLLSVASVVGAPFDAPLLRAAAGGDADAVSQSLDEWVSRRLVQPCSVPRLQALGSVLQYDFSHDKIRAVVYDAIGDRRQRSLHQRMAQVLEQRAEEEIREQAALLAHHWERGGAPEKAAAYHLRAGDRARLLYAHQEAVDHYEQALMTLKEEEAYQQAARTLMKLGLSYHHAFDFRRAHQTYDEAFSLWQRTSEAQLWNAAPSAPHALRVRWLEPTTLDPTMSPDNHTDSLLANLFSGLVALSPELDVVPDVARAWDLSEGGRRFVFHLREDVEWSDGRAVVASDFEYAWKRVLNPDNGSPSANFLYDLKGARAFHRGEGSKEDVGVRATDEVTLVLALERPVGHFPQLLANVAYFPVPQHVVEMRGQDWTEEGSFVTNGPFRLKAWKQDESLILSRNPTYHGRFRGNVESVRLLALTDWADRLEMYQRGELDALGISFFPILEREEARQQHAEEYVSGPGLKTFYVVFDVTRCPFDDARVRHAFAMAADRETLADVVLRGYASPATGGFLPPEMPGHSPEISLSYDPERARQLLAEAGYPGGRSFPPVSALAFSAVRSRAEYLESQWREVLGIETRWEVLPWAAFLDKLGKNPPEIVSLMWGADYADPDNLLRVCRDRTWNAWQNETYDRLVERARQVMDQEERMRLYRQADRLLISETPVLPLTYERRHLLVKPWVSHYPTSAIQSAFWKDAVIEPHE